MHLLFMLFFVSVGVVIELNVFRIVHTFGHMDWAEQRLGSGGSYLAWRLIGLILIIGSVLIYRYAPALLGG